GDRAARTAGGGAGLSRHRSRGMDLPCSPPGPAAGRLTSQMADPSLIRIGLISDTHGLLRPQAKSFLEGCDHIIHAGDIGNASILEELAAIAPLSAVRGNNDGGAWADPLKETELLEVGEVRVLVVHDLADLK